MQNSPLDNSAAGRCVTSQKNKGTLAGSQAQPPTGVIFPARPMPCGASGCWNCSQSKVSPVLFHTEGDVWGWDSWTDRLAVSMFAENQPATCSAHSLS